MVVGKNVDAEDRLCSKLLIDTGSKGTDTVRASWALGYWRPVRFARLAPALYAHRKHTDPHVHRSRDTVYGEANRLIIT